MNTLQRDDTPNVAEFTRGGSLAKTASTTTITQHFADSRKVANGDPEKPASMADNSPSRDARDSIRWRLQRLWHDRALRLRGSVLYGMRRSFDLSGMRQNRPINHDRTMLHD